MKKTIKLLTIAILISTGFLAVNAQESTVAVINEVSTEKVEKTEMVKTQASSNNDSWTGFYVGGFGGYSNVKATPKMTTPDDNIGHFSQTNARAVNGAVNPKLSSDGFNGGGTFGYNYQKGRLLIGGEVDFGVNRIDKSGGVTSRFPAENVSFTITNSVKSDWLMTARPRVGLALPKAVIYGTAGLAVTNIKQSGSFSFTNDNPPGRGSESSSYSETKAGWAAGAGIEFKVAQRWSVKGEYLYSQFGRTSLTSNNMQNISNGGNPFTTPDEFFTRSTDLKSHSIRFGINYRF